MSCVHGPSIRFKNKDSRCRNPTALDWIWSQGNWTQLISWAMLCRIPIYQSNDGMYQLTASQSWYCHCLLVLCIAPWLVFLVLLFLTWIFLQGTPERARSIPVIVLFSPLLLVQAVAVCYALLRLLEQLWLMLPLWEPNSTRRLAYFAKGDDCCGFLHHGSRCAHFLGIRPLVEMFQ